ncbi:MAG TPA: DUF2399 domain-containing protein [Treponema sp.]|nr:DUF2399 domain-containing protein [Treponema sp.]
MTTLEREIADELARRFPSSAHATGGRKLKIRVSSAFPRINRRKPDEYESFLEAAESLETRRIVSLDWTGRIRGEELSGITLCDSEALFSLLGRTSPVSIAESVRFIAKDLATGQFREFFLWIAESLLPKDIDFETGEPSQKSLQDLARLIGTLEQIACGDHPPVLPRALSVELFSDSKRIESLLRIFQPALRKAERAGVSLPPFDLVDRSFPETLVSGSLVFSCRDGTSLINSSGMIMGLPFESIMRISSVTDALGGGGGKVLGVENKETFYALAAQDGLGIQGFDVLIYVGGHPNRAVQSLFRLFRTSGWALFHTGDLDPDGILILQELSDAAGAPVLPWMMDLLVFNQYREQARCLDSAMHLRALRIRPDTLSIPGINALLEAILSTGVGVEQEIIAY